jgi:hypothetical protein
MRRLRLTIVALAALAVALTLIALNLRAIVSRIIPGVLVNVPAGAPPPPPDLSAVPNGPLPSGEAGLVEYARDPNTGEWSLRGSGFLLRLPDNTVIGVTTAHSVGDLGRTGFWDGFELGSVASDQRVTFDAFYGPPGVPRWGDDFTVDYVLLRLADSVDPALVAAWALAPDPRGGPQPGERVLLDSGINTQQLAGSVLTATPTVIWVVMDEVFEPSGMSGSPLLSAHTGQVVGLTIAATQNAGRTLIGFHPMASLTQKAQIARDFPVIAGYRR